MKTKIIYAILLAGTVLGACKKSPVEEPVLSEVSPVGNHFGTTRLSRIENPDGSSTELKYSNGTKIAKLDFYLTPVGQAQKALLASNSYNYNSDGSVRNISSTYTQSPTFQTRQDYSYSAGKVQSVYLYNIDNSDPLQPKTTLNSTNEYTYNTAGLFTQVVKDGQGKVLVQRQYTYSSPNGSLQILIQSQVPGSNAVSRTSQYYQDVPSPTGYFVPGQVLETPFMEKEYTDAADPSLNSKTALVVDATGRIKSKITTLTASGTKETTNYFYEAY